MPELKLSGPSVAASASLRIIAAGIVIAALYFASSVITTLVLSIFIAFVLDPGVRILERMGLPRWVGSFLLVLLGLSAIYLIVYGLSSSALSLSADLPNVEDRLERMASRIEAPFSAIGARILSPGHTDHSVQTVRLEQDSPWGQFLWRGIGSVYVFTVTVAFIPFLVFFMLTSKNHIWAATLNLFPSERRQKAEDVIDGISSMVRQYVLGNVMVAALAAVLTTPIFALIGLPYSMILGPVSAVLNLIPYIGLVLAILPPVVVGLLAFDTVGPFVALIATVGVVHLLSANLLTPKLVGRRVKLNALSVTLALMFWGALWGGMGLVLAIPVTASFKAVCDNVRSLRALGAWLGEG
ncbi:MAG TPA: AI-2E family transporter [Terriglobia bacterium]|nr:AI-2E family transporter [Terriglobia bacterium]